MSEVATAWSKKRLVLTALQLCHYSYHGLKKWHHNSCSSPPPLL